MPSETRIRRYYLVRRRGGHTAPAPRSQGFQLVPIPDELGGPPGPASNGTAGSLDDLSPPLGQRSAGPVAERIAAELRAGRRLFDILDDALLQDCLGEGPLLLGDLAADPVVRRGLDEQSGR